MTDTEESLSGTEKSSTKVLRFGKERGKGRSESCEQGDGRSDPAACCESQVPTGAGEWLGRQVRKPVLESGAAFPIIAQAPAAESRPWRDKKWASIQGKKMFVLSYFCFVLFLVGPWKPSGDSKY